MATSEALVVVLAVNGDVLLVTLAELVDGGLDVLHATLNTHLLGREVAVETGTVPVTGDWLGVQGDLGTEVLGNTGEEVTGDPEIITHYLTG